MKVKTIVYWFLNIFCMWWGSSALSEDQIGVHFLSVFSFSREKYFFLQICLECAETSRNDSRLSLIHITKLTWLMSPCYCYIIGERQNYSYPVASLAHCLMLWEWSWLENGGKSRFLETREWDTALPSLTMWIILLWGKLVARKPAWVIRKGSLLQIISAGSPWRDITSSRNAETASTLKHLILKWFYMNKVSRTKYLVSWVIELRYAARNISLLCQ